jgi:hypothetical protein
LKYNPKKELKKRTSLTVGHWKKGLMIGKYIMVDLDKKKYPYGTIFAD